MPEHLDPPPYANTGDPRSAFADLLRHYRRESGLTQEELAERAGLSARTISDLERGVKQTPRRDTLRLLIGALELSDEAREVLQRSVGSRARRERDSSPIPSNLPAWLTPFVGRRQEVHDLRERLQRDEVRLLTLTGAAGAGKTRLAVEVAEGLMDRFADGVCFVALAPVVDPSEVGSAIARAVADLDAVPYAVLGDLHAHLRPKRMLLVLDNFEHVKGAAPDITELLAGCPSISALVTSRGILRVSGEYGHEVAPLSLPGSDAGSTPECVQSSSEAVELFVQRACAANDQFEPDIGNTPTMGAICRRLDGLPLAIELAAARVRLLGLDEMLQGLDRPLDLLRGGSRDSPARHHALRDTLAWSYQQLSRHEQTAFAQLGVCAGGCDLAAAVALIRAPDENDGGDMVDCLSALVDSSLMRSWEDSSGRSRFGMLETIQAYALERLDEAGETQRLRRLHATYFLDLAERAAPELLGPDQSRWYNLLEIEHSNFHAALTWARATEDSQLGLQLGGAVWRAWEASNRLEEGLNWLEMFLGMNADGSSKWRARALNGAGMLASALGSYAHAEDLLRDCLRLRQTANDRDGIQRTYNNLGVVAMRRGDYVDAELLFEHSLDLTDEVDEGRWFALSAGNLGITKLYQGDLASARRILEDNLERSRNLGMAQEVADTLNGLGLAALYAGDLANAERLLSQSLEVAEDSGNVACAIESTRGIGCVMLAGNRANEAVPYLHQALSKAFHSGDIRRTVKGLDALGCAASDLGQSSRAMKLWATADDVRLKLGIVEHRVERAFHDTWRSQAPESEEPMALDEAVAYALEQGTAG